MISDQLVIILIAVLSVDSYVIPDAKVKILCPLGVSVTFPGE
jgi:hypothetical protein